MVRTADVGKRMAWGQRFQRFDQWTGTVADFCAKERVSVACFYQWRKRLQSNGTRVTHADSQLSTDVGSRRRRQRGRERADKNSPRTGAGFVPVQVVGSAVVEVFFAEGSRLSIPVDATSALQAVVRALSAGSAIVSQDSGGRGC